MTESEIDRRDWGKILAQLTVEKARSDDTESAIEILRDFVGAIDKYDEKSWSQLRSAPIHWEYVSYIAAAFEKIVRAEMRSPRWPKHKAKWSDFDSGPAERDANKALGIKISAAGRREGATTHDNEALAAAYNLLRWNGLSPKDAKLSLKKKLGVDVRTIEKANKRHLTYRIYLSGGLSPECESDDREIAHETIKLGAQSYAAEIAAILAARKNGSKQK